MHKTTLYQKKQKRSEIAVFEPIVTVTFLHRHTSITNHVKKVVQLSFFEAGNIASLDVQTG